MLMSVRNRMLLCLLMKPGRQFRGLNGRVEFNGRGDVVDDLIQVNC